MRQAETEFWISYRLLAKRLLRPLGKSDGFSETAISQAEKRLGLTLPHVLREFYLLAGTRKDINETYNRLLAPEDLLIDDNTLVFYEENQAACVWGVAVSNLSGGDPPVARKDSTDTVPVWEDDFDHASQFLTAMLFMQAVNGGMRHHGVGTAADISAPSDWGVVRLGGSWNNTVLMRDGVVLYIFGNEPGPEVFGAAKSKRKLLALEKEFQIAWDYCTLDDE